MGTRHSAKVPGGVDRDHPHACGDKFQREFPDVKSAGSSPRVWGQGYTKNLNVNNGGIIPTRVGTSKSETYFADLIKDHPHACGDKNIIKMNITLTKGSSPRVWGQEELPGAKPPNSRIIPTRVGTRHE